MSYEKIGFTTVATTQNLLAETPLVLENKEIIRLSNSILSDPGQPSTQLPKLIRLTAYKQEKHTSRWYKTVYIP